MAKAQLNIGVDVNAQPAKKKMNDLKKEGVDTVEELGAKNRESIKGLIGMFAPMAIAVSGIMMAFGAIKNAIVEAFSQGKVFQEFAEKTNLSAESMAHLKAVADSAGVSTKEFEKAMDDLANGRTSLRMLQEEWAKLGNSINTTNKAQKNFIELGKTKNLEEYGERWDKMWGGVANWVLSKVGIGFEGEQEAIMESAAYRGLSYEEAKKELYAYIRKNYRSTSIADENVLQSAYDWAIAKKYQDERESEHSFKTSVAKRVMESGMNDEEKVATFARFTEANYSLASIKELAESTKTREDKLNEEIKRIEEARKNLEDEKKKIEEERKKAEEERKKAEEERKKAEEDYVKSLADSKLPKEVIERLYKNELGEYEDFDGIQERARANESDRERRMRELREEEEKFRKQEEALKKQREEVKKREEEYRKKEEDLYGVTFGLRDAWTSGGGLIGNAMYGLRNENVTKDQLRVAMQQLKQSQSQTKSLKEIESAIKGDK